MAEVTKSKLSSQRLIHRQDGGRNFSRHNDHLKHWPPDYFTIMRDSRTNGPGMTEGGNHKQIEPPCFGSNKLLRISTPLHVKMRNNQHTTGRSETLVV